MKKGGTNLSAKTSGKTDSWFLCSFLSPPRFTLQEDGGMRPEPGSPAGWGRDVRSCAASWHITSPCSRDEEVLGSSSLCPFSPLPFPFWRPGSHPFSLGFSLGRVSRWVTIYLLDRKSLRAEKSRSLGLGAPNHLETQQCMESHAAGMGTTDNPDKLRISWEQLSLG